MHFMNGVSPEGVGGGGLLCGPPPPSTSLHAVEKRRAFLSDVFPGSPNLFVFYFPGGFGKFHTEYPEHCETLIDSSCPSSSPPLSVLGFGNLRISSDCSDGESDREPGSATEPEESPVPGNQPAFPVEILPYLYLGCAKDSTNLDVLGRYNIKYILNVTPNLPNMFEHDRRFRYKKIPISDHWSQNLSQFFPEAISFIGGQPFILITFIIIIIIVMIPSISVELNIP